MTRQRDTEILQASGRIRKITRHVKGNRRKHPAPVDSGGGSPYESGSRSVYDPVAHMSLQPGTRKGQYEIVSRLGAGGMGEAYLAQDTRLGQRLALKVLPEVFQTDSERLARFEREARMLASLSHPNIATIFGLEEIDGQRLLAMELAEGEDLSALIARGPIPPGAALPIAGQIAEALSEAHEKGVVHGDLKPANVKVSPDGRSIAFVSEKSGRPEVFVAPVDHSGAAQRLSREGRLAPRWRRDGRELYFLNPAGMLLAARIGADGSPAVTGPEALFRVGSFFQDFNYEAAADGQRFLLYGLDDRREIPELKIALHWNDKLAASSDR